MEKRCLTRSSVKLGFHPENGSHQPELGEGCWTENLFSPPFSTKIHTRNKRALLKMV